MYDRIGYKLIATYESYAFEWDGTPETNPAPVRLQDGSFMRPGDCFTGFRGRHTASGFPPFSLAIGMLVYVGSVESLNGVLLLFTYDRPGPPLPENLYYGFVLLPNGSFLFSTPSVAARIVETTLVTRTRTEETVNVATA